jgi:hypothetical protein
MDYKAFPFYQRTNLEMVFNNTYEVYRRHFGWMFFFSFLFMLILQPLTGYMMAGKMDNIEQLLENPEALLAFYKDLSGYLLLILLTYSFFYLFLTYFVIARYLEPEMSIGAIAGRTLTKYYLRFLLIGILSYFIFFFGILLGLLALIVGAFIAAIFLGISLSMVLPVLLVEDTSVFQTFKRSFKLVLKDFWTILGYFIIFILIISLMSLIFSAISMAPYVSSFFHSLFNTPSSDPTLAVNTFQLLTKPLYVILNAFFSALLMPLTPIFITLVYFHLRYVEDEQTPATEIDQV